MAWDMWKYLLAELIKSNMNNLMGSAKTGSQLKRKATEPTKPAKQIKCDPSPQNQEQCGSEKKPVESPREQSKNHDQFVDVRCLCFRVRKHSKYKHSRI